MKSEITTAFYSSHFTLSFYLSQKLPPSFKNSITRQQKSKLNTTGNKPTKKFIGWTKMTSKGICCNAETMIVTFSKNLIQRFPFHDIKVIPFKRKISSHK